MILFEWTCVMSLFGMNSLEHEFSVRCVPKNDAFRN